MGCSRRINLLFSQRETTGINFEQCIVFYLLIVLAAVFVFAVPRPKLEKPQGYAAVDIHLHAISSYDNIAPIRASLKSHLSQGFAAFFNTEHNPNAGFCDVSKERVL